MYRWVPLTSALKEPAESWISGRKRSLRYDVSLTSPWTIDGVLHLGNPVTPGPRTKALRVVAWSSAPRLSSHVDSSSTSTSLLNLRKNTARHGRPLTIPARHQGLGARHGDIIGLGRRHQLHICYFSLKSFMRCSCCVLLYATKLRGRAGKRTPWS